MGELKPLFEQVLDQLQQQRVSERPGPPRLRDSLETHLSSETGSDERGSTGGASPAAHGVPDGDLQSAQRQDGVKRSLERTGQGSCVGEHGGDELLGLLTEVVLHLVELSNDGVVQLLRVLSFRVFKLIQNHSQHIWIRTI